MVQHVICTDFIDSYMKRRIDKCDEELEKRLDDKNFIYDYRAYFYINNVDEADKAAHGDVSNTLSEK